MLNILFWVVTGIWLIVFGLFIYYTYKKDLKSLFMSRLLDLVAIMFCAVEMAKGRVAFNLAAILGLCILLGISLYLEERYLDLDDDR